jgi:hypothetical protein
MVSRSIVLNVETPALLHDVDPAEAIECGSRQRLQRLEVGHVGDDGVDPIARTAVELGLARRAPDARCRDDHAAAFGQERFPEPSPMPAVQRCFATVSSSWSIRPLRSCCDGNGLDDGATPRA